MSYTHIAYIDEAGDEGFGKLQLADRGGQSQWLLLGAFLVRVEDDASVPSWRDEILARFPRRNSRELHFRNLKHEQKVVACQVLAAQRGACCIVFSNKRTIMGSKYQEIFKKPGYLYNYMTRWLLERVTSHCKQQAPMNAKIKIIFSRRGGTNYQTMREYLELQRDGREKVRPVRNIIWSAFDPTDIVVENHSKWAGLQLADVVTSAFFAAVEPNFYGNYETRYAELFQRSVLRERGNALNSGITPVPSLHGCAANPHQEEFFRTFISEKA